MEQQNTGSNKSDVQNMFDELLNLPKSVMSRNFKAYINGNPDNIAFMAEIYNLDKKVWEGYLDLTISEETLKIISEKMNALLNIVHVEDEKIYVSFNKGKTIISIDYKGQVKRNIETKKLNKYILKK